MKGKDKVISCNPSGEIDSDEDTILTLWNENIDILSDTRDETAKLEAYLKYGDTFYSKGYDRAALKAYSYVFRKISWHSKGKMKELLNRSYFGLSALCNSNDEYVWEECSQLTSDYDMWQKQQS